MRLDVCLLRWVDVFAVHRIPLLTTHLCAKGNQVNIPEPAAGVNISGNASLIGEARDCPRKGYLFLLRA